MARPKQYNVLLTHVEVCKILELTKFLDHEKGWNVVREKLKRVDELATQYEEQHCAFCNDEYSEFHDPITTSKESKS